VDQDSADLVSADLVQEAPADRAVDKADLDLAALAALVAPIKDHPRHLNTIQSNLSNMRWNLMPTKTRNSAAKNF